MLQDQREASVSVMDNDSMGMFSVYNLVFIFFKDTNRKKIFVENILLVKLVISLVGISVSKTQ